MFSVFAETWYARGGNGRAAVLARVRQTEKQEAELSERKEDARAHIRALAAEIDAMIRRAGEQRPAEAE